MSRARFLLIRIAKAAVVVFAIAVANFFLIRMAPGDPAQVLAGQSGAADEKYLAQLRQQFGLDQPIPPSFSFTCRTRRASTSVTPTGSSSRWRS